MRSRSPSSENAVTTDAWATKTAAPAWTNTLQPVAAADRDDAGEAAQERVDGELERLPAVHRTGEDREQRRRRARAAPASSRTVSSIATAAVGRMYGSHGAVRGQLEREHAEHDEQQADEQQRRCCGARARAGSATSSARSRPTMSAAIEHPAAEAREVGRAVVQAELLDRLERDGVDRVAPRDDHLVARPTLAHRRHRRRSQVALGVRRLGVVRGVRDDERGDELDGETRFGAGEAGPESVADLIAHVPHVAVADLQLFEPLEDTRRLGAHGGPAVRFECQERVPRLALRQPGQDVLQQCGPVLERDRRLEGRVDRHDRLFELAELCGGDGDRPRRRVVVLGLDAIAGALRARSVRTWLV